MRFLSSAKDRSGKTDSVSVEKPNTRLISLATASISSELNSPMGEIIMVGSAFKVWGSGFKGPEVQGSRVQSFSVRNFKINLQVKLSSFLL